MLRLRLRLVFYAASSRCPQTRGTNSLKSTQTATYCQSGECARSVSIELLLRAILATGATAQDIGDTISDAIVPADPRVPVSI